MRLRNLSLVAMAVAAGLSLTACQGDDDSSASSPSSGGSSQSDSGGGGKGDTDTGGSGEGSTGGSGASGGSGGGSAGGSTGGGGSAKPSSACKTSQLAISRNHGMGEGDILVHLMNTGSAACTLKGFPGVDLQGKDGTVSAQRSKLSAPTVKVAPGDETRFTLHYPPNDSGGSGVTFHRMTVTPPNETHSKTLSTDINIPASDSSTPAVRVDPVGTGK
ncbi:DUF4232 domain-containing protein [Streptomyces sp. NPDC048172]|uniref:DUF4232 domain-containing protein n=1 Tax=Streptomyces sp. NPDC048172 TaxID=3365505 RepID=UPI003714779B